MTYMVAISGMGTDHPESLYDITAGPHSEQPWALEDPWFLAATSERGFAFTQSGPNAQRFEWGWPNVKPERGTMVNALVPTTHADPNMKWVQRAVGQQTRLAIVSREAEEAQYFPIAVLEKPSLRATDPSGRTVVVLRWEVGPVGYRRVT